MMKIVLPIVLALIGAGAGIGAGLMLRPDSAAATQDESGAAAAESDAHDIATAGHEKPAAVVTDADGNPVPDYLASEPAVTKNGTIAFDYPKLSNQFVVPIIRDEHVVSLVVIALSLEMKSGTSEIVYTVEPRLRDNFLQAMFDHAAIGGFDGAFANNHNLMRLRRALREKAYKVLGDAVNDVLITEIARQDVTK